MPSAPKAPTSDGRLRRPGERKTENREQSAPAGRQARHLLAALAAVLHLLNLLHLLCGLGGHTARRRRACGCRGCFPLPGRGAAPHILYIPYFKARNGGRRSRSAAKTDGARSGSRPLLRLCGSHSGNPSLCSSVLLCDSLCLQNPPGHAFSRANAKAL